MQGLRTAVIRSALDLAKVQGWTDRTLLTAVTQHKLAPVLPIQAAARGLFPNGAYELIEDLFDTWDSQLQKDITAEALQGLNDRQRIHLCLRKRLEYETPFKSTWGEAISLGADCDHFTETAGRLWTTWGLMLRLTGDESAGVRAKQLQFYQKCAQLGWAFLRAEQTLLTDGSPDHQHTWNVLPTLY